MKIVKFKGVGANPGDVWLDLERIGGLLVNHEKKTCKLSTLQQGGAIDIDYELHNEELIIYFEFITTTI